MATINRKTGTRKKSPARKKSTATATKTKVLSGKKYTHVACSTTKTGAKKLADTARAKGKLARVVAVGKSHCVYVRGAR